jgi:hypothetical protein
MSSISAGTTTNTALVQTADTTGDLSLQNSGVTNVTVKASGNVGIGTSSPGAKLSVSDGTVALITSPYAAGSTGYFGTSTNHSLAFLSNNTERMRIDSSGNLLVGTTAQTATEKLSVIASSTVTGWFQTTNASASGVVNIYSVIPTTAFNTNCAHFAGQTAGVNTYFLYGNGTTSYTSDINLKKNVVTTRDVYIDDLAKLRVVKYQWKTNSDDSKPELGLIAQEVAKVFPGLVQDSIPVTEGGATNKVILGSVLTPILIKSVQELYQKVQELTAEVAALKGI